MTSLKPLRELEGLVGEDARKFAPVRAVVRRGSAFREIVRLAEEETPDLIVLPTHARTGLEHMLWGSVAEKVVRLAPYPVMTVSPRQQQPQAFGGKRVLFATDFSSCSEHALESAVSSTKHYGADIIVMSTHGRTGVSHLVIGSTAERVVRYARCPVLTVKQAGPPASLDD